MDLHETESRTQVVFNDGDDDYIDMKLTLSSSSPSSTFISFAVNCSPPHNRDFEFQMCSSAVASGESTTSPADELFYKGQLLPLHLPPRLQMVQKLLSSSSSSAAIETPISPRAAVSSPRRFSSSEIVVSSQNEDCFFEISTEIKRFVEHNENRGNNWSKSISQKLKASRAYIKALFFKPSCSNSSEIQSKFKIESINQSKTSKNPYPKIQNPQLIHRRSFSGVIQRHYQAKCSSSSSSSSSGSSVSSLSSSFSLGSNGSLDLQMLMRSSNASSEIDNSIEGAIKHCKQSFIGESGNSSSRTSVSTCGEVEKE